MFSCNRLRNLRKEAGLKQAEIADILKIVKTTYSKYETGDILPPSDMVLAIANFFEVSADYLLDNTNDPTPPNKKNNIPMEKLKLLNEIDFAYHGGADKDIDEEDVDDILEIVRITRQLREKRNKR